MVMNLKTFITSKEANIKGTGCCQSNKIQLVYGLFR